VLQCAGVAEDPFVTVMSAADPVEAEVVRDLLQQEGIPSSSSGHMHSSLLGAAGGALIPITIQVPRSMAAEAQRIIAAMREFDHVLPDGEGGRAVPAGEMAWRLDREDIDEEDRGEGPYRSALAPVGTRDQRLKRVATFCAIALTFGAGHFYARQARAGLLLLLGEVAVIAMVLAGHTMAIVGLPVLVAADLAGSLYAVSRPDAATAPATLGRAAARLAPWLALVIVLVLFVGPHLHAAGCEEERGQARVGDRCAADRDCARGLCVAGVAGSEPTCTVSCGASDDCPRGWSCSGVTAGGVLVCRRGPATPFGQ